jgi:hypothetical protein
LTSISLSQNIVWEKSFLFDTLNNLSGNYIVNSGNKLFISAGISSNIMGYSSSAVLSLDSAGKLNWYSLISKKNPLYPSILSIDKNGDINFIGYYVLYWYSEYVSNFSPFLKRYNSDGKYLFEFYSDTNNSVYKLLPKLQTSSIYLNKDYNLLVTTHVRKQDTLDLLVFDSNVNFINQYRIDTSSKKDIFIYPKSTIQSKVNNKIYLCGIDVSPQDLLPNSGSLFLISLDSGYKKNFKKYYSYKNNKESPKGIGSMSDGSIIIISRIANSIDTTREKNILRKLDENGKIIFEKTFGDESSDICFNFIISKNDEIFCFGSKTIDDKFLFKLRKFDKNGIYIWGKTWGNISNKYNKILSAACSENSEIFITGRTGDSLYVAKLEDNKTDIKNEKLLTNASFVSPNPATDFIEISVGANGRSPLQSDVKIYNVLGEIQTTPSLRDTPPWKGGEKVSIDVSSLAPGMYFIRIGDKFSKFVKL